MSHNLELNFYLFSLYTYLYLYRLWCWNPTPIPNSRVNNYQTLLQSKCHHLCKYKTLPKWPQIILFRHNQWSFSMQNPRSSMWKHMLLLRARAVHAMTREILFLLFHLQRNALQVFLLESFSQRILISCELFIYEHPKQMSMVIRELNKRGYSFRISKCSLSGFTDHNLAPTLIRMTPSSFLFYCSLCSNEFTRHSFTMQSFF